MRQRHIKIKKTNNKTPPHWGGVRYSISTDSGDHAGSPLRCPFRNVDFTGLPQNANAVRFVGKRRRRRPKRRFFAGKPSNCDGSRLSLAGGGNQSLFEGLRPLGYNRSWFRQDKPYKQSYQRTRFRSVQRGWFSLRRSLCT